MIEETHRPRKTYTDVMVIYPKLEQTTKAQ